MKDLMAALGSIWTWLVLVIGVVIIFPLMVLSFVFTTPFDRRRRITGRLFRWAAVIPALANPLWHFSWSGQPPAVRRRPHVVVSNHESFADIMLLSMLPWEMKWLAKAELFRIPVVGWMMAMAGDVPIKRGFGPSAVEAMRTCRERLAIGMSIMVFPEGTRSPRGDLLPFKDGAFRLAVEAGVPVLPLAVYGTRTALRKRGIVMRHARARAVVLEPVETAGLTLDDVPALRDRVREMVAVARDSIAAEIAGRADPTHSSGEAE